MTFSNAIFRHYLRFWLVGWLFIRLAFTPSSLQNYFLQYYLGALEMKAMRFTKTCQDLPRRLLVISAHPPLSSDLSSSDLYTCGSPVKHFAGTNLSDMKREGRLWVQTLSIFSLCENRTRSVLLEVISSQSVDCLGKQSSVFYSRLVCTCVSK